MSRLLVLSVASMPHTSHPYHLPQCPPIHPPCTNDIHADAQVAFNLVRNYSPHLKPNTRESPIGIKVKDMLMENARTMLVTFLRKSRNRRLFDAEYRNDRDVSKVCRCVHLSEVVSLM